MRSYSFPVAMSFPHLMHDHGSASNSSSTNTTTTSPPPVPLIHHHPTLSPSSPGMDASGVGCQASLLSIAVSLASLFERMVHSASPFLFLYVLFSMLGLGVCSYLDYWRWYRTFLLLLLLSLWRYYCSNCIKQFLPLLLSTWYYWWRWGSFIIHLTFLILPGHSRRRGRRGNRNGRGGGEEGERSTG